MKKIGSNSFALDTNVVINLFKGQQDIAENMEAAKKIYLPVPVLAELYLGAENSNRKAYHFEQIQTLLKLVDVMHTSDQTAEKYGLIKAYLRRNGTPIPENDIWIAALCEEYSFLLVTRDKHFKNIPDLKIVEW